MAEIPACFVENFSTNQEAEGGSACKTVLFVSCKREKNALAPVMFWGFILFCWWFSFFKFFSLFQAPGKDSLELFRAIECSHSNWADTAKDSFPILMCVRLLSLLLGHQNERLLVVWLGRGSKEWCAVAMSWTCTERGLCSCSLLPEASWLYDEKDVLSIDLMTLFSWPESTVHPLCFHF